MIVFLCQSGCKEIRHRSYQFQKLPLRLLERAQFVINDDGGNRNVYKSWMTQQDG